ncbi:WD-repeat protein, partial [Reticulomyxa filosa]
MPFTINYVKLHFLFQHRNSLFVFKYSLKLQKKLNNCFQGFVEKNLKPFPNFNTTGVGKFYYKLSENLLPFLLFYLLCNLWPKQSEEEKIQVIIQHWIRILQIKFGWIHEFDKLVVNYVSSFASTVFMFDTFRSSSKLLNTFTGHTNIVWSIDYSIFDYWQFICSGSHDNTVCVWDVDNNKQIQSFNGHSSSVYCVKFSPYHYHNHRQNIICSSSQDETIRFWDFKHNKQLQIFNGHTGGVISIEFSSFNGGRYLCSGSYDNTIRLWDVKTSKLLH